MLGVGTGWDNRWLWVRYGGVGVVVCERCLVFRWLHCFSQFSRFFLARVGKVFMPKYVSKYVCIYTTVVL